MPADIPSILAQSLSKHQIIASSARWQPLQGGRTNRVWRVDHGIESVVCKLYTTSAGNPLYPNLPGAEFEALKALAEKNISPKPLALLTTKVGDVLVYQYLEGSKWQADLPSVARLLANLHTQNIKLPLRKLPSGSIALVRQTRSILRSCKYLPDSFPACPGTKTIAPFSSERPIHTDVVVGNLIDTTRGLRLIDWQCPALGDPCEDIASFLSPAMQYLYGDGPLSPNEIQIFLSSYPDKQLVIRYLSLAPFFHWRTAAYCLWQSERGKTDYKKAMEIEISALDQAKSDDDQAGHQGTKPHISN